MKRALMMTVDLKFEGALVKNFTVTVVITTHLD